MTDAVRLESSTKPQLARKRSLAQRDETGQHEGWQSRDLIYLLLTIKWLVDLAQRNRQCSSERSPSYVPIELLAKKVVK